MRAAGGEAGGVAPQQTRGGPRGAGLPRTTTAVLPASTLCGCREHGTATRPVCPPVRHGGAHLALHVSRIVLRLFLDCGGGVSAAAGRSSRRCRLPRAASGAQGLRRRCLLLAATHGAGQDALQGLQRAPAPSAAPAGRRRCPTLQGRPKRGAERRGSGLRLLHDPVMTRSVNRARTCSGRRAALAWRGAAASANLRCRSNGMRACVSRLQGHWGGSQTRTTCACTNTCAESRLCAGLQDAHRRVPGACAGLPVRVERCIVRLAHGCCRPKLEFNL